LNSTITLAIICLLHSIQVYGQSIYAEYDYTMIDSFAKTVVYKKSIKTLSEELTAPFTEDIEKYRAIFIWVTHHIDYDYQSVNKGKALAKLPKCDPKRDCAQIYAQWKADYIDKVLRKRSGVCSGYALLFERLCQLSGLKAYTVNGYTKTRAADIGYMGRNNHAWNAIILDGKYHFVDPTWAAGYGTKEDYGPKILTFTKSFDPYYWLTPRHLLSRDHYPADTLWQKATGFSPERFKNQPYVANILLPKLQQLNPCKGILEAKPGDTLHFEMQFSGKFRTFQINTNAHRSPSIWKREKDKKVLNIKALEKQIYHPFQKTEDGVYRFSYLVEKEIFFLEILLDHHLAIRYKVVSPQQTLP